MVCEKESFPEYRDGIVKLTHMNSRKGRHKYRLYPCDLCGNFHITTITKNLRTPKKDKKYPMKISEQGSSKIKDVPKSQPISRVSHPEKQTLSTEKMISQEQAKFLKKLIELSNQ